MISLQGRRIALVGGAGFIGHHLALELKKHGALVEIVDSLQVNNLLYFISNPIPNRDLYLRMLHERLDLLHRAEIPLYTVDARDYSKLSQALDKIKPQVIVHLAAVAHANRSNKDPYSTFDHSLRTLENALDFSRGTAEHFIYFSSSMAYGNFNGSVVIEETICDPIGIYGALKLAGEKIVIAYHQVFQLPYTIVRPSALYGPRCVSRRVGQIFIENALKGEPIMVAGNGSDRLDFTYIGDLVGGIVKVIENEHSKNQIFNLTYGQGRSIAEMAEIVRSHFPNIKIQYEPKDNLMPERGTLSVEKARRLIGYEPAHPLEKGLPAYIEWYKEFVRPYGDRA